MHCTWITARTPCSRATCWIVLTRHIESPPWSRHQNIFLCGCSHIPFHVVSGHLVTSTVSDGSLGMHHTATDRHAHNDACGITVIFLQKSLVCYTIRELRFTALLCCGITRRLLLRSAWHCNMALSSPGAPAYFARVSGSC